MSGQSDLLTRLNGRYAAQCDGDWEHKYGITIETLDNPGWRMRIDLTGTALLNRADFENGENEGDPQLWMVLKKSGNAFEGAGAPGMLDAIIARFLKWKDGSDE